MPDPDSSPDQKPDHLIEAAAEAFLLYGFKRTSMEDIATQAGVSRAALYLHFRNKRDVFRSVVDRMCAQSIDRFAAALGAEGPVADTLFAAFTARYGSLSERVFASPHGAELMAAGRDVAGDRIVRAEAAHLACLTGYFARGLSDDRAPAEIADMVLAALRGLKEPGIPSAVYLIRLRLLADAVAGLAGGR